MGLMVDSDPHCGGGPDIISNKEKVIPIAVANSKATRAASSAVLPAETNGSSSAVLQMKYFLPKLSSNFLFTSVMCNLRHKNTALNPRKAQLSSLMFIWMMLIRVMSYNTYWKMQVGQGTKCQVRRK